MFITFEGGEGAGKTTQIHTLEHYLKGRGYDVVLTREPGGTPFGEYLRKTLLNPDVGISFCADAELLLFLASRAQHIEEVILPSLEAGKFVLCDRFHDSTIAYQGGARHLGIPHVRSLCALATYDFWPSLTFYLDIAPEVGLGRITASKDRLESEPLEFHQEIRKAFHQLATLDSERIQTIDATQTPEQVSEAVLQILDPYLEAL